MLTIPILDKLRSLRLYGLLKSYQEQTQSSEYADLSFEERFGLMIDRELTEQENKRLNSRLRRAKLRHQACMENIDYRSSRGLDKSLMKQLSTGQWIKERLNILITGPCGAGKSFIACALAQRACLEGYSALYMRAPCLFENIAVARGDGRYSRLMNYLAKTNLLVIDDWGLSALTEPQRRDLLEIMEDRHNLQSTIITSQLPVKHWHEIIGNQTLADAILDRLVHNAYKITLCGESMRKKHAITNK
ncbi:MAG: IS21-like element helper ATPase IstB [Candidatus Omnitrophica bacterium]|nr:IS21-like element helper ATPase IstB [Candidatus Omnitrophota bacterium]